MSILTTGNDDGTMEIIFQYQAPRTWIIPAGYSVKMDGYPSDRAEVVKAKESPWTGEGLPPVGTMVTIDRMGLHIWPDTEIFIGPQVKVLANYMAGDEPMIVVEDPDGYANCCFRACMARKPLTPEQIAAEERDQEITEISSLLGHFETSQQQAERLYLAGYRKQVKP